MESFQKCDEKYLKNIGFCDCTDVEQVHHGPYNLRRSTENRSIFNDFSKLKWLNLYVHHIKPFWTMFNELFSKHEETMWELWHEFCCNEKSYRVCGRIVTIIIIIYWF